MRDKWSRENRNWKNWKWYSRKVNSDFLFSLKKCKVETFVITQEMSCRYNQFFDSETEFCGEFRRNIFLCFLQDNWHRWEFEFISRTFSLLQDAFKSKNVLLINSNSKLSAKTQWFSEIEWELLSDHNFHFKLLSLAGKINFAPLRWMWPKKWSLGQPALLSDCFVQDP